MDGKSKVRNIMELVRVEFRPDGVDREAIKDKIIKEMESEGFIYKNEVALTHYTSDLVFEK